MGTRNIGRLACSETGFSLPGMGCAFIIGQYGATGATLPSGIGYAKGCLLINIGGDADYQLWVNEGAGQASVPTWEEVGDLA